MQFLLYEIVARVVAIYLCVDTGRELWNGFVERKIAPYSLDFLDWFNPWSNRVAHRDASPIAYWAHISVYIGIFLACLVVAIFGWWQPST
jgi:hypothetical protein